MASELRTFVKKSGELFPVHPRNHRSTELQTILKKLCRKMLFPYREIEQLPSQVLLFPHRLLGYQFIKLGVAYQSRHATISTD